MKNDFFVNKHDEMDNYKVKALYDEKIYDYDRNRNGHHTETSNRLMSCELKVI